MEIKNWNELENFVAKLLEFDKGRRTPGSGSTKSEEDVYGESFIAQCKFTEKKTININQNDIDRLIEASGITCRFPLFISSSDKHILLSIPYYEDTTSIIDHILRLASFHQKLDEIKFITTGVHCLKDIHRLYRETNKIARDIDIENTKLRDKIKFIQDSLDRAIRNKTNIDLFEG